MMLRGSQGTWFLPWQCLPLAFGPLVWAFWGGDRSFWKASEGCRWPVTKYDSLSLTIWWQLAREPGRRGFNWSSENQRSQYIDSSLDWRPWGPEVPRSGEDGHHGFSNQEGRAVSSLSLPFHSIQALKRLHDAHTLSEGKLLCWAHQFKCQFPMKTRLQTHREMIFSQISGHRVI